MEVDTPDAFLEPVYLNEKMVLNCAAYVFKGYSLDSEVNDTAQTAQSKGGEAGLRLLGRLISIGIEAKSERSSTTDKQVSAALYRRGPAHVTY